MKPTLTTTERWNAPTSKYFQPIQIIAAWIGGLSAAIAVLIQFLHTSLVPVPELVNVLLWGLGVLGAAIAAVSKLTVDFDAVNWQKLHEAREIKLRDSLGYFR